MAKKIRSFTIKLDRNSATIIPEKETKPWYRKRLDRARDGIVCEEIMQDLQRIANNLTKKNEDGEEVGKYDLFIKTLSPSPKSSQGKLKTFYKALLISKLERHKDELLKFKDKEVLIYIAMYFRKEKYKTRDVDNHLKAIIDATKTFIGDDSKAVLVFGEKKLLEGYPEEDMDFLEQVLLVITDPAAKADILKN